MSEAIRESLPENAPELEVLSQAAPEMPLRWHGFLAKFYLWLAAAYHLFQAAWIFTGKIYIEPAAREAIYSAMPGMRILDYSFAGLLAAGAVVLLLARGRLSKKKKTGIALLKGAYILLILTFVSYLLARLLISGMPPLSLPVIGQAVSCAALLLINRSYYRKRSNMFNP